MLRLAECEKAVTISEPMGCPRAGSKSGTGSKTPIGKAKGILSSRFAGIPGASYSWRSGAFHPVFSDLRAETGRGGKRLGSQVHYLLDGHVVTTRTARFGPIFVTILPIGVCVCSI